MGVVVGGKKKKKAGSFWIGFIPSFCEMLVNVFPPSRDFSFRFSFFHAADFGVSAKNTKTLQRRDSFIGTPYW